MKNSKVEKISDLVNKLEDIMELLRGIEFNYDGVPLRQKYFLDILDADRTELFNAKEIFKAKLGDRINYIRNHKWLPENIDKEEK